MEHWNGSTWEIEPVPIPEGSGFSLFGAVSCTGPRACVAAGYYVTAAGPRTLVERWDGHSWKIEPSPTPATESQVSLTGISCSRRRPCTAVGFSQTGPSTIVTLAERWDGNSWEIQPTPNPADASISSLTGVSCPTRRICTAVGEGGGTLAMRWEGDGWEIEPAPDPAGATNGALLDVSCRTRRLCMGVGTYFTADGRQRTLAERYTRTP